MTMLTSRPDCLAPDSTAQACLEDIVALLAVSSISKPWVRDGMLASGSNVRKQIDTNHWNHFMFII